MNFGQVREVSDMDIDEISLVDRPANQFATISIAKRHEGADMPQQADSQISYTWPDGTEVDWDQDDITPESEFLGSDGFLYQLPDEAFEPAEQEQGELVGAGVSKSAFDVQKPRGQVTKSLADELRETIEKSAADESTREVLGKALAAVDLLQGEVEDSREIIKSERDLRLDREYIAKAAEHFQGLPITADELGPILKRLEERMPAQDCQVLAKMLGSASNTLFTEFGKSGGGTIDGSDPWAVAQAQIDAGIAKSADGEVSKAAATEQFFSQNPLAYDEYMAGRGR